MIIAKENILPEYDIFKKYIIPEYDIWKTKYNARNKKPLIWEKLYIFLKKIINRKQSFEFDANFLTQFEFFLNMAYINTIIAGILGSIRNKILCHINASLLSH